MVSLLSRYPDTGDGKMKFILIVLFICGEADTVLFHNIEKNKTTYTHEVFHPDTVKLVKGILSSPEEAYIISYEEDRGLCT